MTFEPETLESRSKAQKTRVTYNATPIGWHCYALDSVDFINA